MTELKESTKNKFFIRTYEVALESKLLCRRLEVRLATRERSVPQPVRI